MVRKAAAEDIDAIEASYNELFEHERTHGSYTEWVQNIYPARETAERGVRNGEMYVCCRDGKFGASMILNSMQPPEYGGIPWAYPAEDSEVLVVHTLCVPPSMVRRGIGALMLYFAEGFAAGHGLRVIRLDTDVKNTPAQAFYKKLGFRTAGTRRVLLDGKIDSEHVLLEYMLV